MLIFTCVRFPLIDPNLPHFVAFSVTVMRLREPVINSSELQKLNAIQQAFLFRAFFVFIHFLDYPESTHARRAIMGSIYSVMLLRLIRGGGEHTH